jgi:ribosomal protein S18 acetylase RimI-like enzyme
VIEMEGRIVGYATIGPVRTRLAPRTGEIYELYIRPEYHGTGLGQLLFAEARRRLSAKGLTRLVVWSLAANEIGCRFYRALGGEEAARSTGTIGGAPLPMIGFAWT